MGWWGGVVAVRKRGVDGTGASRERFANTSTAEAVLRFLGCIRRSCPSQILSGARHFHSPVTHAHHQKNSSCERLNLLNLLLQQQQQQQPPRAIKSAASKPSMQIDMMHVKCHSRPRPWTTTPSSQFSSVQFPSFVVSSRVCMYINRNRNPKSNKNARKNAVVVCKICRGYFHDPIPIPMPVCRVPSLKNPEKKK